MKKIIFVVLALIFVFAVRSVSAQKAGNKVVCFISDMDCSHCEQTITAYLKFEKGVKDLKVDHVSNTILVEYKDGKNTDDQLAKAVEKKGYKAVKITKEEYEEILKHSQEGGHEHEHEQHTERKEQ